MERMNHKEGAPMIAWGRGTWQLNGLNRISVRLKLA